MCYSVCDPPLAQLVEQLPFKELVVGSIPTGRTKFMPNKITALIVIDVQNFFAVEAATKLPQKIAEHIKSSHYDYVLFTTMRDDSSSNFKKILNWEGPTKSPDVDIHPLLAPFAKPETTFEKTTYSAFKSAACVDFLEHHHITDLDLCGINIDACVLASAFEAFDLGYRVRILEDFSSISSFKQEYIDSAKVIIKRNLKRKD